MSQLVISLDFELFWGVCETQTIASYGNNVKGEWEVIPRMLKLFRQYGIRVTWATVGMAMCRDFKEWRSIRPSILPGYRRTRISPYGMEKLVKENPRLFFARPLVERILATPGQELATHTYSHFYCREAGATPEQFAADLLCSRMIAADIGVRCRSLVFPRNQVAEEFLGTLPAAGIQVYRGNADHWLYRNGDTVKGGIAGRAVRLADASLPISGTRTEVVRRNGELVHLPASLFVYPWHAGLGPAVRTRLFRLKQCMTAAARTGRICHLWWHPHNFGKNLEGNLAMLESLLQHFRILSGKYGMHSSSMGDFAALAGSASDCLGIPHAPSPSFTSRPSGKAMS